MGGLGWRGVAGQLLAWFALFAFWLQLRLNAAADVAASAAASADKPLSCSCSKNISAVLLCPSPQLEEVWADAGLTKWRNGSTRSD